MDRNEIIAKLKENINKLYAPKTDTPVVETELADVNATPATEAKATDNADMQAQIDALQAQIDEILQMIQSITMGAEKPNDEQEKLAKQYEDLKKSFEEFAKAPASAGLEVSKPEIKTDKTSKEEKLARIKELANQPYIQELAKTI